MQARKLAYVEERSQAAPLLVPFPKGHVLHSITFYSNSDTSLLPLHFSLWNFYFTPSLLTSPNFDKATNK